MSVPAEKIYTNDGYKYLEPERTGCRFKNPLSKYRVVRNEKKCIRCGRCVEVCPFGVHTWSGHYLRRPLSYRCQGFKCKNEPYYCVDQCPEKALSLVLNPNYQSFGDKRWSADLLLSTWWMAEFGTLPYTDIEYRTGDSGGGSTRCGLFFPGSSKTQNSATMKSPWNWSSTAGPTDGPR